MIALHFCKSNIEIHFDKQILNQLKNGILILFEYHVLYLEFDIVTIIIGFLTPLIVNIFYVFFT